ncbi:uncharacterized protein LOC124112645 isoform X1 [Haliotis rufescens]|uniref:uncharacterized protein LOC124112645 isoform X1 n=2 Tax=Haliotis rufescens TaxID=6454 RepID=UPI00201F4FEC|nr:uncharacterized protein LOC124112645 isoform X1 [Haliotis rufescens]
MMVQEPKYTDVKVPIMTNNSNQPSGLDADSTSVFLGSSATYSGEYNAIYRRRYHWSTSSPEQSDECCLKSCCGACYFLGYLFCLRQMTRAKRAQIIWTYCFALAVVGAMVCALSVFGPFEQDVTPTDMRIVNRKISTLFCDSLTLDSTSEFSAYLLNTQPDVDTDQIQKYQQRDSVYILNGDYSYWKFYLLEGSVMNVMSCADANVDLYIMKGEDNFNTWKKDNFCSDCFIQDMIVTNGCQDSMDHYTLNASTSDDYYFVYKNNIYDTWVTAEFRLKRTLYNTNGFTDRCLNSVNCDLDLDLDSNQVIVYHISDDSFPGDLSITTTCNARPWVYVLAFAACPLFLGCVLTTFVCTCCKDPRSNGLRQIRPPRRVLSRFSNERTSLLAGRPRAEVPQPPRYEEVDSSAPPSYEQITT